MQSRNHVVRLRPRGSKYLEQKERIKEGRDEEEPSVFMESWNYNP